MRPRSVARLSPELAPRGKLRWVCLPSRGVTAALSATALLLTHGCGDTEDLEASRTAGEKGSGAEAGAAPNTTAANPAASDNDETDAGSLSPNSPVADDTMLDDTATGNDQNDPANAPTQPGPDSVPTPGVPNNGPDGAVGIDSPDEGPDAGSADPEPAPSGGLGWYYFKSKSGLSVSNTLEPDQEIPITESRRAPWSPDGKLLAQVVNGEVVFHSLEATEARVVGRHAAPQYTGVDSWLPGYGPLLLGQRDSAPFLGAMNVDGDELVVVEGGWNDLQISPAGDEILYTLYTQEGVATIWHRSVRDGMLSEPAVVGRYSSSPPLAQVWTPDGYWMAFTISGEPGVGGLYLWHSGGDPIVVTQEYSPGFHFSKTGSLFAYYTYTDAGETFIHVLPIGEGGIGKAALATSGEQDLLPPKWTGQAQLSYTNDLGGWIQPIAADGTPEPAIPFPDYSSACEVRWVDPNHFIHNCDASGATRYASIENGALDSTELYPGMLDDLGVDSVGKCVVGQAGGKVYLGPADPALGGLVPIPTLDLFKASVVLSPDGKYLIWTEDEKRQLRVEVTNCKAGGVVLMREQSGTESMGFLPVP